MCRKIIVGSVDILFIAISRAYFLPNAILLSVYIAWLKPTTLYTATRLDKIAVGRNQTRLIAINNYNKLSTHEGRVR